MLYIFLEKDPMRYWQSDTPPDEDDKSRARDGELLILRVRNDRVFDVEQYNDWDTWHSIPLC